MQHLPAISCAIPKGIELGPENIYPAGERGVNRGEIGEAEHSNADEMYELCHCLLWTKIKGQREVSPSPGNCLLGSVAERTAAELLLFSPWATRHPLGLGEKRWDTGDCSPRAANGHSEHMAGFYYSSSVLSPSCPALVKGRISSCKGSGTHHSAGHLKLILRASCRNLATICGRS